MRHDQLANLLVHGIVPFPELRIQREIPPMDVHPIAFPVSLVFRPVAELRRLFPRQQFLPNSVIVIAQQNSALIPQRNAHTPRANKTSSEGVNWSRPEEPKPPRGFAGDSMGRNRGSKCG